MKSAHRNRWPLLDYRKECALQGRWCASSMLGLLVFLLWTPMLASADELVGSGFLEDYSQLVPDPSRLGTYFWMNPGFHPKDYHSVMVGPVEVWYHPESKYQGIRPAQLSVLTTNVRETLIKRLAEGLNITREPGSGTLLINAAIVDLEARRPKKKAYNFLPLGVVTKGIKSGMGKNYVISGTALEAELIDTQSGERMGLIVVKNLGDRSKDTTTWEEILLHFDEFARMLVRRIGQ